MTVPQKYFDNVKSGGLLSYCKPVSESDITKIKSEFSKISEQFLSFIREIGISENHDKFGLCWPISGENFAQHPSSQIYNSSAGRSLFPKAIHSLFSKPNKTARIYSRAVVIYETGASWRYGFDAKIGGDSIYCLDFSGPQWTKDFPDFFTFIESMLSTE